MRVSAKLNSKPSKVYIKNLESWEGKSVGVVLERNEALKLAEALVRVSREANNIDVTIFPKAKTPTITVTYLKR